MNAYRLIDRVVLKEPERVVAAKRIDPTADYLRDHFPGFPVLPGVFMLEAMVQAARELMGDAGANHVLGRVRALKYGRFVRPEEEMRVEVFRAGSTPEGWADFRGEVTVDGQPCASGRVALRPARLAEPRPSPRVP